MRKDDRYFCPECGEIIPLITYQAMSGHYITIFECWCGYKIQKRGKTAEKSRTGFSEKLSKKQWVICS
jgi:hypothetical protein